MTPTLALAAAVASGLALAAAACGPVAPSVAPARSGAPAQTELTVFAAASLSAGMEVVASAYAEAVPGTTLTVSTGASSALRAQIEQGAPADVFLSADTKQPGALVDVGLAAGDARVFAANQLAIIVPTRNGAGIVNPADLARPGVKIIAAGDAVPVTAYAREVVANLGSFFGYPADFVGAYTANVVSKEDDVKAVVAKIELGEGDAAIVYRTDALASQAVKTVEIPAAANVSAKYAAIVVDASAHSDQAAAFLDWLVSAKGQAVLASFGFSPPGP